MADWKDEGVSRADKYLEKQGPRSCGFFALLSGGAQSRGHPVCDVRSHQRRLCVWERGGSQQASEPGAPATAFAWTQREDSFQNVYPRVGKAFQVKFQESTCEEV